MKTVTICEPSTGRKLEQITPGILRITPVTRNTVNLTPKTVTLQNSNNNLVCRCLQPTNFFILFISDLSYVGFVPIGDFLDINGDN
jgi:hypothetical protein